MPNGRVIETTSIMMTTLLMLTGFKFAQAVVEPANFRHRDRLADADGAAIQIW
jgi:hypothetical protein